MRLSGATVSNIQAIKAMVQNAMVSVDDWSSLYLSTNFLSSIQMWILAVGILTVENNIRYSGNGSSLVFSSLNEIFTLSSILDERMKHEFRYETFTVVPTYDKHFLPCIDGACGL